MWMARSDLSNVWLQRRRWRAFVTCDVIVDLPDSWCTKQLQYCPLQTNACLPCSSGWNRRKAGSAASNSRQSMCQRSQGPVQACLLHVAPQPVQEAYILRTTFQDTCSKGTPAHRKARSDQGLNVRQHIGVMVTWCVLWCHAHLRTRLCNQCWRSSSSVTAAVNAICPRSLWNCFSGTTVLSLKELQHWLGTVIGSVM